MESSRRSAPTKGTHARINLFLTGLVLAIGGVLAAAQIWLAVLFALGGSCIAYWSVSRDFAGIIFSKRISEKANAALETFLLFCQLCDQRTRLR